MDRPNVAAWSTRAAILGLIVAAGIGVLIGHYAWTKEEESGAPAPQLRRAAANVGARLSDVGGGPAKINGPVNLTRPKLAAMLRAPTAPTAALPSAEDRCADGAFEDPDCRVERSAQANALPVISVALARETKLELPSTPAPTRSWQATLSGKSGFPADAQIAVSSSHVIVGNRQQLRYYDKNGNAIGNAISSNTLFSPLNLKDAAGNAIDRFNDVRLVFDEYRKRFWVTTYAFTSVQNVPTAQQRYFLPMAVSKTQNPLDGWYLYSWDGASQQGNTSSSVWKAGDKPDYPIIGIDPTAVTITHSVSDSNGIKYWRVTLTPAQPLANGVGQGGWQYWDLKDPDGSTTSAIAPAVHHGYPQGGWAYWTSRHESDQLVVWRIKDPFKSTRELKRTIVVLPSWTEPVNGTQKGSTKLIKFTNLGTQTLESVYRNGNLYTVTNDARDWGNAGTVRTSIRFIRLSVGNFPNIPAPPLSGGVSRTFGGGNPNEEISGNKYYGWPGVEVNKAGNAIIGYVRTGDQIYPEVRASAFLANEDDIRPSRQLKAGETAHDNTCSKCTTVLPWGDTAGSAVDPADDTSIWVAQEYASSTTNPNGNYDIWVAQFFGPVRAS